jgi:Xylose isomerase-like TIM barrel
MAGRESAKFPAAACDLAAQYDVTCDLENLSMWGVKTLRQAWSIVSTADRPNGGIVFDALHYIRSGSTLDMLKEIPGDHIHCVQLNDGPLRLPAGVTSRRTASTAAGQAPASSPDRDRADLGRQGRTASGEPGGVLASQRHSQRDRDRCPVFRVTARPTRRREHRILPRDTTSATQTREQAGTWRPPAVRVPASRCGPHPNKAHAA